MTILLAPFLILTWPFRWWWSWRWWVKVPVAAVLALIVVAVATFDPEAESPDRVGSVATQPSGSTQQVGGDTSNATPIATEPPALEPTEAPPPAAPGIGDTVQVGNLDLTLHSVDSAFDPTSYNMFNDANVQVGITAVNARGDSYNVSPALAFKLIDSNGVAHSPTFCAGCPDEIGSTDLVANGRITGFIYFAIPEGVELVQLHYQPFLSTNEVTFVLGD